jgi:CheY-like chemotaxis protein
LLETVPDLRIQAVPSEIREVIVNLLRNAVDALSEGGIMAVRTYREGDEAILCVEDTGVGMDEATRSRIFEPFFTTKGVGQGTGLGLAVAWGIVTQHGGRIGVQSHPGDGATFLVHLPLASQPATPVSAPGLPGSLVGKHLLLVDDHELLARGMAGILSAKGAVIATADDAQEALRWLSEHHEQCDAILTDQALPGTTGLELLAQVQSCYPKLRRVLLSGWGATLAATTNVSAAELILEKPVPIDTLVQELTRLLDSPVEASSRTTPENFSDSVALPA